jgi:hypothetical protein
MPVMSTLTTRVGMVSGDGSGRYGPRHQVPKRSGALPDSRTVVTRKAKAWKTVRLMTLWRLCGEDTLLGRWPYDLQDMAAALGPCIQEEHPMVREGDLSRQRPMAPAAPTHVRAGMVGGAARAGVGQGRGGASAADDAVEARGVDGFG